MAERTRRSQDAELRQQEYYRNREMQRGGVEEDEEMKRIAKDQEARAQQQRLA